MKRKYSYITIGKILDDLELRGCHIKRDTFKNLMFKENLFQMQKNAAGWYVASPEQAVIIIKLVLDNYAI